MDIAIVGGSISGCIAAGLLDRAGHKVTVYERSARGLIGRGGGVTTSRRVLDAMKADGLLPTDFPSQPFDHLRMRVCTDDAPRIGRSPLSMPLDMHCVHWSGLWEALAAGIPEGSYLRGRTVTGAEDTGAHVRLTFEDDVVEADLAIFADGYNSLGRRILFPEARTEYRGYLVWRGVLPEAEMDDLGPLAEHPRYSLRSMPGSFVSFVVPSREGSTEPGTRTINWALYLPVPEEETAHYLTDASGRLRVGTVPSGEMRAEVDEELKALMVRELPSYYAEIPARSSGNQIQLIYTNELPAYGRGRICLAGDAGIVVQPLTGSGLFKGYTDASALADVLAGEPDAAAAVARWSGEQIRIARRMRTLGMQMETAFIWDTIDLARASPAECDAWWQRTVTVPEEFSYFATEPRRPEQASP